MPDEKKKYKMELETGFYGLRQRRLPESLSKKAQKRIRYYLNKAGLGHLIIRGKAGRPKNK
jgi:hypothetical protein